MARAHRLASHRLNLRYPDANGAPEGAVQIRMLGGFRISFNSRAIDETAWRLSKAKALLQLLLLTPGRKIHREQLMHRLWPDNDIDAASGNLYQVVHAVRRALKTISADGSDLATMIRFRKQVLTLEESVPLWVDVDEFEHAARTALRSGDLRSFKEAISLYSGDLLPEHPYDEWLHPHRERLWDRYWRLLIDFGQLLENSGDYSAALDAYRRAVECDPTRERAHTAIMRVEAGLGQPARALEQFDVLEELLSTGLGIQPDAETRRLRDEIAAALVSWNSDGMAPRASASGAVSPPNNLPAALTNFVGREREVAELGELLSLNRLVSVVGPGGSGKSRLALALAQEFLSDYPDGVWRVSLADTRDPALLSQTIAAAFDVTGTGTAGQFVHLERYLANRRLLLILDGCEHLTAACTELVTALLSSCPNLRVLVTSREPLRANGEVIWRIPLLDVPDRALVTDTEDIARADSVRLFVDRARLAQPEFQLTHSNAESVITVCERADGLPLAIELAAGKLRALSVEQVAARLDHSVSMLIRSSKNIDPNGETLVYTLDWSYSLLTEPERLIFERVSTFVGGWSLEAAEFVASGEELSCDEVVDTMVRLADKSLIQIEPVSGEVRYRMLDTVQQYARDRLRDRGKLHEARQRHAAYFMDLLKPADQALRGPEQSSTMDNLNRDHDNLRATISWFLEAGWSRDALRYCHLISRYWALNGNVAEGRMWLERALTMDGATGHLHDYSHALFWSGRLAYLEGDYSNAEQRFLKCLRIARERDDLDCVAASLSQLGHVSWRCGDLDAARSYHEASLSIWRESADSWSIATSLRSVGYVALNESDLDRAQVLIEESLQLFSELEDRNESAHCMFLLGQIAYLRGDYSAARSWQEGSLSRFRIVSDWLGIVRSLCEVGYIAVDEGELEHARRQFQSCLERYRDVGSRQGIADCLEGFAAIAVARHQPDRALRLAGAASTVRSSQGEPPHRVQQCRRDRIMAQVNEMSSQSSRDINWYQGRSMPLDEVIGYAMNEQVTADS